jgi:hypothetical protein
VCHRLKPGAGLGIGDCVLIDVIVVIVVIVVAEPCREPGRAHVVGIVLIVLIDPVVGGPGAVAADDDRGGSGHPRRRARASTR